MGLSSAGSLGYQVSCHILAVKGSLQDPSDTGGNVSYHVPVLARLSVDWLKLSRAWLQGPFRIYDLTEFYNLPSRGSHTVAEKG